jgi:hypothetical protein
MQFFRRALVSIGLLVVMGGSAAVAEIRNSFDSSVEDWRVVSYPFRSHNPNPATTTATFDPGNGLPAGSLRIGDIYGETGVAAPIQYLGDKSACYGGTLSYDIYLRYTDGATYPAVVLNAGTMSLYYDTPSPPVNTWSGRSILLVETGWRVSGSQQPATAADFAFVLANLKGLYIYTEWHTGADDTNVDNVRLAWTCDFAPDYDHDCDVDAADFDSFQACASGPGLTRSAGCENRDFDADNDVDQSDFAVFQRCYRGENNLADPNCAN